MRVALDMYQVDCRTYPTKEQGLKALIRNPGVEGWKGPYIIGRFPLDPWGLPFEHNSDGQSPKVRSSGPDLRMGTGDDITE